MKHIPCLKTLTITGNVRLGYDVAWCDHGALVCWRHVDYVPTRYEASAVAEGYRVEWRNTVKEEMR
jgi:hypothetical protein